MRVLGDAVVSAFFAEAKAKARNNPGFDAIVGNPPFLGGSHISGSSGKSYLAWMLNKARAHGTRIW
jgi:hypothetical protein